MAETDTPFPEVKTAYLVFDTESVPDGELISRVHYENQLTPDDAINRFQQELQESSRNGSDFVPVSFHLPVAIAVARVAADLSLIRIGCLDTPEFRPETITQDFWKGVNHYKPKLVTFNGRRFDLPLMELSAFRYGISAANYCQSSRNRFNGGMDLCDWLTNFGAFPLAGGLDLLAKMIGKPGKMGISGDQVLSMYRQGRKQEINDYCLCDTLDTYFVFLRTRLFAGDIDPHREQQLVHQAKEFLESQQFRYPVLREYLANWEPVPPAV